MDKGFSCYDGETVAIDEDYHMGCKTPTRDECRIPAYPPCPPPVRRKRSFNFGKKRQPPKKLSVSGTRTILFGGCSLHKARKLRLDCYI
ncbi:unnamed protein product [Eruca vesicaria subsp. sativa]|uniref:Uncharacterized protein n=1 Tax=Eruca vesicaria subsp. sativa TaxID=29727 RepID=A0ABC8K6A0_ERUVS|nr:unnamed protein product [Eruca vesicaria subsp. sativa]